jgi:hypothetical protein
MSTVFLAVLAIGAGGFIAAVQWGRIDARWKHDLPQLLDNAHEWQSVPGSAVDRCLDCPATRVRRWVG